MNDEANPYSAPQAISIAASEPPEVGSPMTVEYANDLEDYVACALDQSQASWKLIWQYWNHILGRSLLTVGVGVVLFRFLRNETLQSLSCLLIAYGLVYPILTTIRRRSTYRKHYQRAIADDSTETYLRPVRVSIEPARVIVDCTNWSLQVKWRAVESIVCVEQRAYVAIGQMYWLIIPQRAFASGAHFQAFVDTARLFLARARGTT